MVDYLRSLKNFSLDEIDEELEDQLYQIANKEKFTKKKKTVLETNKKKKSHRTPDEPDNF